MKKRELFAFNTMLMIIFISLSILIYFIINNRTIDQSIYEKKVDITNSIENITNNIFSKNIDFAVNLSRNENVQYFLETEKERRDIEIVLESIKDILEADIVYILNNEGTAIASSTYNNKGDTLYKRNYKFRAYFKEAMRGNMIVYPAVGITTQKRGLYFTVPVFTKSSFGTPKGVIVIKTGFEKVDAVLEGIYSPTVLVSDIGIVFSSNNSKWLYSNVESIAKEDLEKIKENKQYENKIIEPFPFIIKKKYAEYNDKEYFIVKVPFFISDWVIYSFINKENISWRNSDITIFAVTVFSLLIFLVFISYLKYDIFIRSKLEQSLKKYYLIVQQSPSSIIITDVNGKIEFVNPKFEELTGYSQNEVLGRTPKFLKSGKYENEFYKNLWATIKSGNIWEGELFNLKKDGSYYWEKTTIAPLKNRSNKIINYIALKEDITERKYLEDQLQYYANTDEMTQALNRRSGLLFLKQQMLLSKRNEQHLTIAYIDIDNLKEVNDNFGHQTGDDMITEVVSILKDNVRGSDIVARIGGDEFLLIFPNCTIEGGEEILKRVYQDIHIKNKDLHYNLSISFGFAQFFWDNPSDVDQLISDADKAMYEYKSKVKKDS